MKPANPDLAIPIYYKLLIINMEKYLCPEHFGGNPNSQTPNKEWKYWLSRAQRI